MTRVRHLVAAILVYVALDFCLASMPGAFVFEASASVESTVMSRTRDTATVTATAPCDAARWDRVAVQPDRPRRASRVDAVPPPVLRLHRHGAPFAHEPQHPVDEPH